VGERISGVHVRYLVGIVIHSNIVRMNVGASATPGTRDAVEPGAFCKAMKLIDKIAKYGCVQDRLGPEIPPSVELAIRHALREAVCVEVGNVAEWFFDGGHGKVDLGKMSPMFVLPFDTMWCEYLHIWNWDGVPNPPLHVGFLLVRAQGETVSGPVGGEAQRRAWGIMFSHCSHIADKVLVGQRFQLECRDTALYRVVMEKPPIARGYAEETRNAVTEEMVSMLCPAAAAISFFHCPNVRIVNNWPDKPLSKIFERKNGVPLRMLKAIQIHRPTDRDGSPNEEYSSRILDAHMVRGHFKRYNNLFGSIAGVWFWRPHVRGKGIPEKRDYEVFAPDKNHKGKCVVEV
jgi:hypothetical protein